jgi:hypothetical protein
MDILNIPSKELKSYSPLGETDIPASGASTVPSSTGL